MCSGRAYWSIQTCRPAFRSRPRYAKGIFSPHYKMEEFKNATVTTHFGFVFEKNSVRSHYRAAKTSISKKFSVHTRTKSRRFQILRFWRASSKSSVFVTVLVDGRPSRRNEAAESKKIKQGWRLRLLSNAIFIYDLHYVTTTSCLFDELSVKWITYLLKYSQMIRNRETCWFHHWNS